MGFKVWVLSFMLGAWALFAVLRFGIALSKRRTLHERRHAREARKFLKEARASTRKLDQRPRLNKAWVHGANLDPVMTYLSNCK